MREPLFLTLTEVIKVHTDQIKRYGGQQGIRDVGLLESALAQPEASFPENGCIRTSMRWRLPMRITFVKIILS